MNLDEFRTVRARTFAMIQGLSQKQLDYVPEPGAWSVGEQVDHLILAEQVLRRDIAILIERAKAGQTPYLYRSFAEFNARPAFLPECALPWLEAPLTVFSMVIPASVREYVVRNVPFPAQAPDVMLPRPGRTKAELCEELGAMLHETEALFAANPSLDYDNMRHQHPLFGIQTVPQLVRILWLHEQAHQDQITRILASPQFPKAA
jgi:DinB family protein